ncbi:class D sortase [Sporosarcina siberiensis]|uniref:Class D sortase n=1 Tax=Sporosarcina siberiensis TaxID=1365606 RepID=A0ABW4SIU3_9BACL
MLKKIAFIMLLAGLFLLVYGIGQLKTDQQSEKAALIEAKEVLEQPTLNSSTPDLSFENGQTIGILQIPIINKEIPIVEGTNEDVLKRGVGHYSGTVYPGENNQILLSGHRDTVFTGLDKLQNGDKIIVEMQHGSFTYVVTDQEIVDADDRTVIRSTAPEEILTLSTCYPFRYIGNAPQRYIVYAEPM